MEKTFDRPMVETLLTPRLVLFGAFRMLGDWRVKNATARTITLWRPNLSGSARFCGKRYQYRWDGTGYKRGGEYLKVLARPAE